MGNVQMEADQIRFKNASYSNVQTALSAALTGGGGSTSLADLTDTTITSPSNGQILQYDGTSEKWVNAAGGSGATTLEALTDTDISTPSGGQVLTYDGTSEKWENAPIPAQSVDGLSDTTITTPTDGQVLTYDGTAEKWVNANGGSGASTLDGLTDTDITTPTNGQVLTYDSTSSKWVNANAGGGGGSASYLFDDNWGDERVNNAGSTTFTAMATSLIAAIDYSKLTANTKIRVKTANKYLYLTPGMCSYSFNSITIRFAGYDSFSTGGASNNYFYDWFDFSFKLNTSTHELTDPMMYSATADSQTYYDNNTSIQQIAIEY